MSLKFASKVLSVISVLLSFVTTESYAVIDIDQYQIPMASAPISVTAAIETLPDRKAAVISVVACGSEMRFIEHYRKKENSGDFENSEDLTAEILGKMVYSQHQNPQFVRVSIPQPCQATVTAFPNEICQLFEPACRPSDEEDEEKKKAAQEKRDAAQIAFLDHPAWKALTHWPGGGDYTPDVKPLRNQLLAFLPDDCKNGNNYSITASTPGKEKPSSEKPPWVRLTFTITSLCLKAQVNTALRNMSRGEKQVGTDGVPCFISGVTKGDWDATLKDLIRIAELDRKFPVLDSTVRTKLNDELIDIDGGPAQEGYHLWECGNEEKSVGNPQTRSDERDGFDGFLDDLGDTLEDLFWLLLIILLILTIVAPLIAAIVSGFGLLAALGSAVVVAIIVSAVLLTIPETENHLWMINSTKYLNNQYIIANGGTGYWDDQNKLREWILKEMQRTLKEDFLEYNSRPYQRYSLVAITNLADFAKDEAIRTGARLVLEYAVAKYSVASNEGRRIAPYRRKRESLQFVDGIPRDGTALTRPTKDLPKNGLFDLSQGADYLHVVGLLYYGFSLNLLEYPPHPYAATISYASNAIYFATSDYLPDKTTYSLAMDRTNAPLVHQRLHHGGWEIVSSGRSFTITAGGRTTGMPKNSTVDAIDSLIVPDDLGVAVPTMLMLTGPSHIPRHPFDRTKPEVTRSEDTRRSTFDRFLRFEGKRPDVVDSSPSYDSNMCVWDGFACGVNLVIPHDLREPCLKPGPRSDWFFIRSDDPECPAYKNGPRFSMVVYNKPTFGSDVDDFGPTYSIGFIEIVDGDEMTFDEFKARILQRNPGPVAPIGTSDDCKGTFVSARGSPGQRIEFDCERVTKVDAIEQLDPTDWEHAAAPPGALGYAPMQSTGTGKVELTSRIAKRKVILNFEQMENPMFDTVTLP